MRQNKRPDPTNPVDSIDPTAHGAENPKKKALWSLLFLAIAGATVWAVISQARSFTMADFVAYVRRLSKPWLLAAVAAVLGYIYFEGEAIHAVCRAFGCHVPRLRGFAYSATDLYFSAITPSATGGQPACAYFMVKDGVPPMVATVALLVNLVMYIASILLLGAGVLIFRWELFLAFHPLAKALIVIGYLAQLALAGLFLMLVIRGEYLHRLCLRGLRLLARLRLVRHVEAKEEKLAEHMEEYRRCARLIAGHTAALVKAFCCNLCQRALFISVPMFVYLAAGGSFAGAGLAWALQCYAVIGANTIPIPGAMGVSDYLMLDGFRHLLGDGSVVSFELLSRSLSFYACVLFCGAVTLATYLRIRARRSKRG